MKIENVEDLLAMYSDEIKEVEETCGISSIEEDPDVLAATSYTLVSKFAFSKYKDKFEKICLNVIDDDPELGDNMREIVKENIGLILRSVFTTYSKQSLLALFRVTAEIYQSDELCDFISSTVYDEQTED